MVNYDLHIYLAALCYIKCLLTHSDAIRTRLSCRRYSLTGLNPERINSHRKIYQ